MSTFDYATEEIRDILMIDVKSFYASCECIKRGVDPMKAILVVMSTADNTGSGLVLASSPMAKKTLGVSNVSRARDVPTHPDLIIAPPRMRLYIEKNMLVNNIFKKYVAEDDLLIYSIDESILDVTETLDIFIPDKTLTRSQRRDQLGRMIQRDIYHTVGLYVTVGIGDNPLLAKLALDNESKHNDNMRAEWTYQDVKQKVWSIFPLTEVWGIGGRTEKRLHKLGIDTMEQLANFDPYRLHEEFGVMGIQLFHHANGIDRTRLAYRGREEATKCREKSLGNSQVLHRDYTKQDEIELVVREMGEQVASRIRQANYQTQCVSLYIGYSMATGGGFSRQMKIPTTDSTKKLTESLLVLFRKNWHGETVRHIGVTYSKLIETEAMQLDLFLEPDEQIKENKADKALDIIRQKYGFTALVHASSLLEGARSIARSSLVGGHAGGLAGLSEKKS